MAYNVLGDALNLSLRKPQSLSAVRNRGFKRENVNFSFSILGWEIFNVKPSPNRIVNIYEKAISAVCHKKAKLLVWKEKNTNFKSVIR